MVETPRNRTEIDRNRFVPICGHRPGHFGLGFVWLGGRFEPQIGDFRPDSLKVVEALFQEKGQGNQKEGTNEQHENKKETDRNKNNKQNM
jgi:hypothetical protein